MRFIAQAALLLAAIALVSASRAASDKKQAAAISGSHSNKQSAAATTGSEAGAGQDQVAVGHESGAKESIKKIDGDDSSLSIAEQLANAASSDEYVQVKPEEVGDSPAKPELDLASTGGQSSSAASGGSGADQKSSAADEELAAHLAQDSISQQESVQRAYQAPAPTRYAHRPASGRPMAAKYPAAASPMKYSGAAGPHSRAPMSRPAYPMQPMVPRARGPYAGSGQRQPPSYVTLKGKLTGINSLISQFPHPAPGYPHQGPRHLPRGAAAGYAAFRDFVRAHASKYKQQAAAFEMSTSYPQPPRAPAGAYQKPAGGEYQAQGAAPISSQPADGYQQPLPVPAAQSYGPAQGAAAGQAPAGGGYRSAPKATRVTVAQAFIPHLGHAQQPQQGYGQQGAGYSLAAANPMLSKLYGGHAPQGVGRPEYSKDYGMVIHYPQATVYTEPMTVDQLHRLTGAGIDQVLAQLQHNLANGHRDEYNTIRPDNRHHLGHGLTIHAKEFYAPDKGGRYVPTTAAVISGPATSGAGNGYASGPKQQPLPAPAAAGGYEAQATSGLSELQGGYNQAPAAAHEFGSSLTPTLGSGYERVKQAASASQNLQQGYSSSGNYQQQAQKYGSGEPLSSLTNLIGSELEALYRANGALTKQVEPEIHAQLQAYARSPAAKAPLKYTEHSGALHLSPHAAGEMAPAQPAQQQEQYGANRYANQQPAGRGARSPMHGRRRQRGHRYSARPSAAQILGAKSPMSPAYGLQQPQQPQHPAQYPARPQQQQPMRHGGYQHPSQQQQAQMQQLQSYQAAERALNQQMVQLLRDFQSGDEQYNGKSQQYKAINQGYPHKVMQKQHQNSYSTMENQQQMQQQQLYNQHDGLEIPQGPNDQIGEIAELIEALKGTLEAHRPEPAQAADGYQQQAAGGKQAAAAANTLEDVRYLASALGQTPSYAVQVPVSGSEPQQQAGYQQQQVSYQQQPQQQAHQSSGYQQQQVTGDAYGQQQQQAPSGYEAPVNGYAQQQQPQQQQQQQYPPTQADYSAAVQQVRSHGDQQQYGAQAGSYLQQQPAQVSSGYQSTTSEHSQIINHLVPVAQQPAPSRALTSGAEGYEQPAEQQPAAHGLEQASHQQQPANQIAVAAPTDAHYQQAQSLSSFVDSLPTDYQELLRQPLLEGHAPGASHLAALGQEAPGNYASASQPSGSYAHNATSAAAAAHDSSRQQTSYQLPSNENQSAGSQQQQYSSGSSSSSSSASSRK